MLSVLLFAMTFVTTITLAIRNSAIFIFVLYQAFYFFNPNTKWWGSYIPDFRFSFLIVLTLLIIVAIKWRSLSENKILAVPQFALLYLIGFLYAIASFYAVFPDQHYIALDAIITAIVVITLAFKLSTREIHLDIILWGHIIFAAYVGYYISQVGRVSAGRFAGGAGMVDSPDVNGIAAAIAPALIFCLYYFWMYKSWWKKILLVIFGFFIANGLVLIGSRGAFLGVFVGASVFLCMLFFTKLQRKYQKLYVIGLIIFGLFSVVIVTDKIFWERMFTIQTAAKLENTEVQTGGTRMIFWKAAIDMAKDHPFGKGSSAFIYYSPTYIPEHVNTGRSRNRAVHSTWFEVLTEIGYLGLTIFCLLIYYSFITCKRTLKKLKDNGNTDAYFKVVGIGCGLLCFVVTMTFLNRLRAEIFYWCILYTAIAYNIYFLKANPSDATKNENEEDNRTLQRATY